MNLGMVTSFIIGGLLLLAVLQFNNRVMQNSAEITLDANEKSQLEALRQVISQDFNRIGYGDNNKIKNLRSDFINFQADVYGTGSSTVIWHFQENVQVHETTNPNDRVLKRNGPVDSTGGSKPTNFRVIDFSLTGYKDIEGEQETSNESEVKSLLVEIVFESPEPIQIGSGEPTYSKAVWRKLFIPNNLQFKNYNEMNN